MRISAVAAAVALLACLAAAPASASAADRNGDDYVVPGSYIVVLEDSVGSVSRQLDEHERRDGVDARRVFGTALKGYSASLTGAQVRDLRQDPQVASVEPNRIVRATEALAAGEAVPTGVARIGAGSSTSANPASSVAVAVIDTGVDLDHPELNVADAGVNCVDPAAAPDDDNGHGTHLSGTIGATNSGAGLVGVAPGTAVVPVKALDETGSGTWDQIICGINWVAAHAAEEDIAVANLSFGGLGDRLDNGPCGATSALHEAICNATAAGVRFAVAAGNEAWPYPHGSLPAVPAAYHEVMAVTAYADSNGAPGGGGGEPPCARGEDDRYAAFSNWSDDAADDAHTIAAPGVCIESISPDGDTPSETFSGTSVATPHVAAAAALCVGTATATGPAPGPCAGDTDAASLVAKLSSTDSTHGFGGDPFRPINRRYYGYTVVASVP